MPTSLPKALLGSCASLAMMNGYHSNICAKLSTVIVADYPARLCFPDDERLR